MNNIKVIRPKNSIPYVLVLPDILEENVMIALEVNNLESLNNRELLDDAIETGKRLFDILSDYNVPVVVPIIPCVEGGIPYYQQLSKECFNSNNRMDIQVRNIIEDVRELIIKDYDININNKIFLNGYSSSGVFGERFGLIHPDIIDTICIGGASGSIPVLDSSINYPLGIGDYNTIIGKDFDMDSYKDIKFRYYMGEFEDLNKSNKRFDEDNNPAPMHDMSYFNRSVPIDVGYKYRKQYGRDLTNRSNNIINYLKDMNIDINMTIFKGRSHNNLSGIGVNELGDSFIKDTYFECIQNNKKYK